MRNWPLLILTVSAAPIFAWSAHAAERASMPVPPMGASPAALPAQVSVQLEYPGYSRLDPEPPTAPPAAAAALHPADEHANFMRELRQEDDVDRQTTERHRRLGLPAHGPKELSGRYLVSGSKHLAWQDVTFYDDGSLVSKVGDRYFAGSWAQDEGIARASFLREDMIHQLKLLLRRPNAAGLPFRAAADEYGSGIDGLPIGGLNLEGTLVRAASDPSADAARAEALKNSGR